MASKLKDYNEKHRSKINVKPSDGLGIGYITEEEKMVSPTIFVFWLFNLRPPAKNAELNMPVYPFRKGDIIFINSKDGVLGEVPPDYREDLIQMLDKKLIIAGYISNLKYDGSEIQIQVTLQIK